MEYVYNMLATCTLLLLIVRIGYRYFKKIEKSVLDYGLFFLLAINFFGQIYKEIGATTTFWSVIGFFCLFMILVQIMLRLYKHLHHDIWFVVQVLFLIGIVTLLRLDPELALKQVMYGDIAIGVILLGSGVIRGYPFLDKLGSIYFLLSISLLVIANKTVYGATNWIELFDIVFQPSEIVKITFAFFLAAMYSREYRFKNFVISSVGTLLMLMVLVYKRDLGSALLIYAMYVIISYMYTEKRFFVFLHGLALGVGTFFAYMVFPHIRVRFLSYVDPFQYIDKEGYQITQSLFAISNGKWLGAGLYQGMPERIPVVTTDFIFSAIAEELGAIFALLLIVLFLVLVYLLITQCQKSSNTFETYVALALITSIGLQGFLIMAGVIKLVPLTGVTLPLVSYGGTSLVITIVQIGIIDNLTKRNYKPKNKEYRQHTIISLKICMTILYGGLLLFLLKFYIVDSSSVEINSYNKRLDEIEGTMIRGEIVDTNGKILAYSKKEDGMIKRKYPYKNMFAHVIGYNDFSKFGLEAYENINLLTTNASLLDTIKKQMNGEPQKGRRVKTTLDYELQKIAYDYIGNRKGAVVAIEPSTGKILVMVSKPDFDPNILEESFSYLRTDEENAPLLNRATSGLYAPGSTFKILSTLTYLENNDEEYFYFCKGKDIFHTREISCYNEKSHGRVGLKEAFAVSCNTAFANMWQSFTYQDIYAISNRFFFNHELDYPYYYERSVFPLREEPTADQFVEAIIGQGETLITPLHNAMIISTIANGGILMKPYVVDSIYDGNTGEEVKKNLPKISDMVIKGSDNVKLREYMKEVVDNGTAKFLKNDIYSSAGKTGTAENESGIPHAWFVGYAPYKNPQIAVAIIIESSGSGSEYGVPLAKQLFDKVMERESSN